MAQDGVDSQGIDRNPLIAAPVAHAESRVASLAEISDQLLDLMTLLGSASTKLSLALDDYRQAGRRYAQIDRIVTSIKNFGQGIVDEAESLARPTVAETPRAETAAGRGGQPGNIGARVANSKTVDYAVLHALSGRADLSVPISQDDLEQIARKLEPATKHGSFVAKLGRWKNTYGLVRWERHEDISLTDAGFARRAQLLGLARKDGRLDEVAVAIQAVLGRASKA